jgi:hypothetical protein
VPRHPPNALTSLTTGNLSVDLRLTAAVARRHLRGVPAHGQVVSVYNVIRRSLVRTWERRADCPRLRSQTLGHHTPAGLTHVGRRRCCLVVSKTRAIRTSFSCAPQPQGLELDMLARASFNYSIFIVAATQGRAVGQERFELSTPRLSSVCSNQLSYWPAWAPARRQVRRLTRSLKTE